MTYLFLDVETTGFKKSGALIQEGQARVCQIAMLLTDENGKHLTEFSSLIKPDGWTISDGAHKVHGFTDEYCEQYGIEFRQAVTIFLTLAQKSKLIVAHNSEFDKGMVDIEKAYAYQGIEKYIDMNKEESSWHCTMKTNTHITGGKWPKLEEALIHYTGYGLADNAHDAMYDVKACKEIFFATRKS